VKGFRGRFASVLMRASLRVAPWLVTAGAVAFGGWFLKALIPIANGETLAAVGIAVVLLRTATAVAAVSVGAFALARGLEGRWTALDPVSRRRFAGLATLGGASMAVGAFIVLGPFAGSSVAHSLGTVASAGVLAGLAAWSRWSLRRRDRQAPPLAALGSTQDAEAWRMRDPGRVPVR
jgi:hypothetical protein